MSKSKVLIGVGGSGAKVLEAFTYLTIAGFPGTHISANPDVPDFYLRMVDTDKENGNYDRLCKLLDLFCKDDGLSSRFVGYSKGKGKNWEQGRISHKSVTKTGDAHTVPSEFLWQIDLTKLETLENMRDSLSEANDTARPSPLLAALYGQEDLAVPQTEGFHGRPRIGALRLQYEFEEDSKDGNLGFWNSLKDNNIFPHGQTQLMFTGSIFGGTGASGIPTLVKRCRDSYFKGDSGSSLGMTLMLPYYLFSNLDKECPADPTQFRLNSKLALLYYHNSELLGQLSNPSVYIIGQKVQTNMKTENSGQVSLHSGKAGQTNPALPAELTAAIGIVDYFNNKKPGSEIRYCRVGDSAHDPLNLTLDFPYGKDLETAINRLATFSLLWKIVSENRPDGKSDLFTYRGLTSIKREKSAQWVSVLNDVDEFAKSALIWLLQLDANGTDLKWFRESYDSVIDFLSKVKRGEASFDSCDKKIGDRDITKWLKTIEKAIDSVKVPRTDEREYLQLLYAVMSVCADRHRYN
ncbi:MAG: hypothetical protein LBD85_01070 [Oscillospiraceae bacterium]|jgi:hypothetical protein|nr:hypothetical protein [Oscillospiraceae bacterium]